MPVTLYNRLTQQRADLSAESESIITAAETAGRTFTAEERTRLDAIEAELATVRRDMEREEQVRAERLAQNPAPQRSGIERIYDRAADAPWGYRYGVRMVTQAGGVQAFGGRPDATAVAFGEFLQAVQGSRNGPMDPRLHFDATAQGAGAAVGSDGAFLMQTEFINEISMRMAGGEILSRVRSRTMGAGLNSVEINVLDETSRATGSRYGGVVGYWVDEGTAPTASRPKFARIQVKPRKIAALGYATDELVQDATLLGGLMLDSFGEELRFQAEDAVIEGNGAGKPLGILNANCLVTQTKVSGQTAATIVNANLVSMWARLDARSRANAVWLINQDCEPQLDQLHIAATSGSLEPRYVTYGLDGVMRIKGRPVIAVEYCSTLGTVGDIILADLGAYLFVDKGLPQQASSMHVAFSTDEMAYRVTYRVDGQPMWRSALTPFKGSNTVSPFVALETRS